MGPEDELIALQQKKWNLEGRIRNLKIVIAEKEGECDHDFYNVHDSMGDYRNPTGARCSICAYQIWF